MKMKKALIDQILLGFLLFAMLIMFVATVTDEYKARLKYIDLKNITQVAALSAAKYYATIEQEQNISQSVALGIVREKPFGNEVKDLISFEWNLLDTPSYVIAKIENYQQQMFWYKLLGYNAATFEIIESKAKFVVGDDSDVDDYMPFAINECGMQDMSVGNNISFLYKSYEMYEGNESYGFYGLSENNPDPRTGAQSDFAQFKNELLAFNLATAPQQYLVDSAQEYIENDAQQLASALAVHTFDEPINLHVALLDCNSTRDNMIIKGLMPVSMTNIYCGDKTTSEENINNAFWNQDANVFTNTNWVEWVESKDCSQSGLFRIDFTIRDSNTIIDAQVIE